MKKKNRKTHKPQCSAINLSDCNFTIDAADLKAFDVLAQAALENAKAISNVAEALKTSNINALYIKQ